MEQFEILSRMRATKRSELLVVNQPLTIAIHQTCDGPVRLSVVFTGLVWTARIDGYRLNAGKVFDKREDAENYCHESFRQMFPEHVCTTCSAPDNQIIRKPV